MVCLFALLNSKLPHVRQNLRIWLWLYKGLWIYFLAIDLISNGQKCFHPLIKNLPIQLFKAPFLNANTIGGTPQFSDYFALAHYLKLYEPIIANLFIQSQSLILFSPSILIAIFTLRFAQNPPILLSSSKFLPNLHNKKHEKTNKKPKTIFEVSFKS